MRFGFGATLILALALLPMLRDRRFSRVESSILVVAYLAFVTLAIFVVFD
jgi:Ca2+/Na+ antiporter